MRKIAIALLFVVAACSPGDVGGATTSIAASTTSSVTKGRPATTTAEAPDTM